MYIPSFFPKQMQSLKPSKRKIVKTTYATEKVAKNVQKDLPNEFKGFAQSIADTCKKARNFMTNGN